MKIAVRTAEIIYKELHFMDTPEVIALHYKYALRYKNLSTNKKGKPSAVTKFRLRVWEYIKATVIELKDRGRWDEVLMVPIPIESPKPTNINTPLWVIKGLKPGTDKWKEHWKRYPGEQESMAKHSVRQCKKEGKVACD